MFPAKCIIHALKAWRVGNRCSGATIPSDKQSVYCPRQLRLYAKFCKSVQEILGGNLKYTERNISLDLTNFLKFKEIYVLE